MAGKRVARGRTGYAARGRRRAGRRAAPARMDRTLVRLVICGAVFVALVGIKLLFPQALSGVARSVGQWMGQDADFREAFAAVGRAVSGEENVEDSLREAYTAVFSPAAVRVERTAVAKRRAEDADYYFQALPVELPLARLDLSGGATGGPGGRREEAGQTEALSEQPLTAEEAPAQPQRSGGGETQQGGAAGDTAAQETVPALLEAQDTRVYAMAAIPANASLELRTLGFAYCSPLLGELTSTFGWRDHPVSGGNKFHYGVDLAADSGAAICAFADGEVYATGESSTLGNYIMLRHEGGYVTLYAHCSRVTRTGGSVSMGEKIAEVGETGSATGPHLHFELHDGNLYLNPLYYVEIL